MSAMSGVRPLSEVPSAARLWRAGLLAAVAAAFGVSVARQLGLVLFPVLATATVVGVARQQLARG